MPGLDLETIRHALATAREFGYTEVELELDDESFEAKLAPNGRRAAQPAAAGEAAEIEPTEPPLATIVSPVVGYYRAAKQPLEPGRRVEKGSVVGLVHALGLNNDIESAYDGEIVEVLVTQDEPVMYGQPVATVRL